MKHLQKFEEHIEHKEFLSVDDIEDINKKFLIEIIESGIEPNDSFIYLEFQTLKTDKKNTYIYHIINNYLTDNNFDNSVQNTMRVSVKFLTIKYGDVIEKYKKDVKKDYKKRDNQSINLLPDPDHDNEMIKVPRKIGHEYVPIKILPLNELKTKYSKHKRLKVFNEKGLQCVRCSRIGKYLIEAQDKSGGIHIDVYTKDFELMTVDHIKPKSKGGKYDIENLDPMCCFCNTKKADKYDEESAEEPEKINI